MAEAWGAVDDTGTRVSGYELASQNSEATVCSALFEEVEQGFIFGALQISTFDFFDDFKALRVLVQVVNATLRNDVCIVSLDVFDLEIDEVGVDCEC